MPLPLESVNEKYVSRCRFFAFVLRYWLKDFYSWQFMHNPVYILRNADSSAHVLDTLCSDSEELEELFVPLLLQLRMTWSWRKKYRNPTTSLLEYERICGMNECIIVFMNLGLLCKSLIIVLLRFIWLNSLIFASMPGSFYSVFSFFFLMCRRLFNGTVQV